MRWDVSAAKNGEATLQLNGISIYSKYSPNEDAVRWIKTEVNPQADSYVLIGLGLGYHLKALSEVVGKKRITVYYFEPYEYELFKLHNKDVWWKQSNIQIMNELVNVNINERVQLLIPNVWLKAIGEKHALYELLDTIKVNQISYKRFAPQMTKNFEENSKLNDFSLYPSRGSKVACLVASGPSLNETICWLKKINEQADIYAVGSALKKLLTNDIVPKAVVISDPQDNIIEQLQGTSYTGNLYYLSTANYKAVKVHKGSRYILCQQGYKDAELLARQENLPLLETGGSVATTTFSLIEMLGYDSVVLFGQDLGFTGDDTHVRGSTSGKKAQTDCSVLANDGSLINTLPNLQVYLRWFNKHCIDTKMNVYNTAIKGAQIQNVPLINREEFENLKD